jgi:hypothetical protein
MRASPPRRATSDVSQPLWVSDWWLPETAVEVPERVEVLGRREGAVAELAVSGREVAIRGTREVATRPG